MSGRRLVVRSLEMMGFVSKALPRELGLEFEPRRQVYEIFEAYNQKLKEGINRLAETAFRYFGNQLASLKALNVEAAEAFHAKFQEPDSRLTRIGLDSPPASKLKDLLDRFEAAPNNQKCPMSRLVVLECVLLAVDFDLADSVFIRAFELFDRVTLSADPALGQHLDNIRQRRIYLGELKDLLKGLRFKPLTRTGNGHLAATAQALGFAGRSNPERAVKQEPSGSLPLPAPPPEPKFADDFFWWIKEHADHPPPECQGKFVLIYSQKIRYIAETEEACVLAAKDDGIEGKHYVIMAVGLRPKRECFEIPV